jgi:hypothetical protein
MDGSGEVVARVASLPLRTAWLPDGRLLIVSSTDGRLLCREPDGAVVTYAELGRPGWNDVVADGRGNVYVNGAGFDPVAGKAFEPGSITLATADGSFVTAARWRGMTEPEMVTPGSGQLLTTQVEVPGAGWP